MLTGVRGVGKTTTARILARAFNCIGPDGKGGATAIPCGQCSHCLAIAEDRHIDVIEMDAASRTGVGDIRELIEGVRYAPVEARYKIYIIDEVHMLSTQAFNALLKTLEEPPAHVKFIFATTDIRKVPVTVLSRCQRFDLRRVDAEALAGILRTDRRGRGRAGGAGRARPDRARRRRLGARRAVAARPRFGAGRGGQRRRRDRRGSDPRHDGSRRPQPPVRSLRSPDAGPDGGGAGHPGRALSIGRRSGAAAAGSARPHPLADPDQIPAPGGRRSRGRRDRAPARPRAGGAPLDLRADPLLADAAEGAGRSPGRALAAAGRRDGADPPHPCRRHAAAGRACPPSAGGGCAPAAPRPPHPRPPRRAAPGVHERPGTPRLGPDARPRGAGGRPGGGGHRGEPAPGADHEPGRTGGPKPGAAQLRRYRRPGRCPGRPDPAHQPCAPRPSRAFRAGPDRVPAGTPGADQSRQSPGRAADGVDRPALGRLGLRRAGRAQPGAAGPGRDRCRARGRRAPSPGAGGAGRLSWQRRRGGAGIAAAGRAGSRGRIGGGEQEAGEQEPAAEQD